MRLNDRHRVIARHSGEIDYGAVHYAISGHGEQTHVEHFEVRFRSAREATISLWCFFERRLVGSRRFTCKVSVDGVDAASIANTTSLPPAARVVVESAFLALDAYVIQIENRRQREAKKEAERRQSALAKLEPNQPFVLTWIPGGPISIQEEWHERIHRG
jgi:hypothetical protein